MLKTYIRVDETGASFEYFSTEGDITTMFPPDLIWIEVTGADPLPPLGWVWDGTQFSAPPPPYIDPRPAIFAELDQIDRDSARPLRVLIIANPAIGEGTSERAELEVLEMRAAELRTQLEALPPPPTGT
jgi:hypothetical protein